MSILCDAFKKEFDQLVALAQVQYQNGLFTEELHHALTAYVSQGIPTLEDAWNVCDAFFKQSTQQQLQLDFSLSKLWNAFFHLKNENLQYIPPLLDNWLAVATHQDPKNVVTAIKNLYESELTSKALEPYIRLGLAHKVPLEVVMALKLLHSSGLLDGISAIENWFMVISHDNPVGIASILTLLKNDNLLAQSGRKEVLRLYGATYAI